jgi:SAM-dependent methyltransferase
MTKSPPLEDVQAFFEEPNRYLHQTWEIGLRAELVWALLEGIRFTRILDIGCGDGSLSLPLLRPGVTLALVDLSGPMLEVARSRIPPAFGSSVSATQGDFLSLAAEPRFDLVLCLGVLAHVPSVDAALERIRDSLVPGGHCVLQLTDRGTMIARLEALATRLRSLFADTRGYRLNTLVYSSILERVGRRGLRAIRHRRYSLLLPGMGSLPSRLVEGYQRFGARHPVLSRHGSEVLLLLRRESE